MNKKISILSITAIFILVGGFYYFNDSKTKLPLVGTSLTTINATDLISTSRTTINDNFAALNAGKMEVTATSSSYITALPNLASIGTIATGTWNGTDVDISDYTNLGVTATGIELSGDNIALTSGYNIPLSASTTE